MSALLDRRRHTRGPGLLLPGQLLGALDVSIVNVALPSVRADLGFSTSGLQWVVNAYALACTEFLLLGGRAADLSGRRKVFIGGMALFELAGAAHGGLAQHPAAPVPAPPAPATNHAT